jgi:uncharacterized protein (TIRG00374 family)
VSPRLKAFFQYVVIIGITIFLIIFSLRGLQGEDKLDYLKHTWQNARKEWLFFMAVVAIISHILRAERWRMLMVPSGNHSKLSESFYSLMVGYLVNLVIPRGGEVSRCYNLYKLNKTPVDLSFGTVVVERIVDLLCLLTLIIISFAVESEKLFEFVNTLPLGQGDSGSKFKVVLWLLIIALVIGGAAFVLFRKNQKIRTFVIKTWSGLKQGLLSVFQLKSKGLFVFYSIIIWLLYFVMSYAVLKAFPSTSGLGISAVLSLFAIGSIAMAAPLPGGTGSYHVLVPQGLIFLYHVPSADAVAFTFIFHGWQTLIMIVGGSISLIITSILVKKNTPPL